jgi:hypothetical protein
MILADMSEMFKGFFYTPIMGQKVMVNFEIKDTFEVIALFSISNRTYKFQMQKWSKEKHVRRSSFEYFKNLMFTRFSQPSEFGTRTMHYEEDGTQVFTTTQTRQQVLNMLKYATVEVMKCVDEIITQQGYCLRDYAFFHKEVDKYSTYEEYIHLVACHCIIDSNFFSSRIPYPPIYFCTVEQPYNSTVLESIMVCSVKDL